MQPWISVDNSLPPEGELVDTKLDDAKGLRNEQALLRRGNLWFTSEDGMYVYYTPTHWRYSCSR